MLHEHAKEASTKRVGSNAKLITGNVLWTTWNPTLLHQQFEIYAVREANDVA